MTDTIHDIVSRLRAKYLELQEQLKAQHTSNSTLSEELEAIYEVLKEKQKMVLTLEEKVQALQTENYQIKEELSSVNVKKTKAEEEKDRQIDSLVREIEHCISHLKQ